MGNDRSGSCSCRARLVSMKHDETNDQVEARNFSGSYDL